jgi:plasmid stability protein
MSNLLVRGVDTQIIQALKEQAVRHHRSAEAEHRAILEQALRKTRRKSFAQVLTTLPNVGLDEDFVRIEDTATRMYLLDTNVISEIRKGELRRGMELLRHRGDHTQTSLLEEWLNSVLVDYAEYILDLDADIAQIWGRLRVPAMKTPSTNKSPPPR